jgi:hypothetical protein
VHIDDSLVYLLALVTVAVLMVGLAQALQGPPASREQRRQAMLASHRRSPGLLIGTFAPPPAEKHSDLTLSPVARDAMETAGAPVGRMPAAAPAEPITPPELITLAEPITPLEPEPAPAVSEAEPVPVDAVLAILATDAPAPAADATSPDESIPLDAMPALVALTAEFARPDAVVALDALPEPEALAVVAPSAEAAAISTWFFWRMVRLYRAGGLEAIERDVFRDAGMRNANRALRRLFATRFSTMLETPRRSAWRICADPKSESSVLGIDGGRFHPSTRRLSDSLTIAFP